MGTLQPRRSCKSWSRNHCVTNNMGKGSMLASVNETSSLPEPGEQLYTTLHFCWWELEDQHCILFRHLLRAKLTSLCVFIFRPLKSVIISRIIADSLTFGSSCSPPLSPLDNISASPILLKPTMSLCVSRCYPLMSLKKCPSHHLLCSTHGACLPHILQPSHQVAKQYNEIDSIPLDTLDASHVGVTQ